MINFPAQIIEIYIETAELALKTEHVKLADQLFKAALFETERFYTLGHVAEMARRIARICLRQEHFDKSQNMLMHAHQIYRNTPGYNSLCADVLMELASLASQLSRPRGALLYESQAKRLKRN